MIEALKMTELNSKAKLNFLKRCLKILKICIKNVENGLKSDLCPEEMTPNHFVFFPGRMEYSKGLYMNDLDDFVIYFSNILEKGKQ